MKPKEKAVELYKRIWNEFPAQTAIHFDLKPFVKNCALICVDEVLKCVFKSTDVQEYWNEVKTEIQNL